MELLVKLELDGDYWLAHLEDRTGPMAFLYGFGRSAPDALRDLAWAIEDVYEILDDSFERDAELKAALEPLRIESTRRLPRFLRRTWGRLESRWYHLGCWWYDVTQRDY